jgi:outer membrane biosynthesis protein TonB
LHHGLGRSREEIKEAVGAFDAARRAYADEAALVNASKGKLDGVQDREYAVYEKRKLVSMREAAEAAREEALTAKRLRDGLLGPLTEDERDEVERLRMEKVEAARRISRIADGEEDRPYKGRSEPTPMPEPEPAKEPEPTPMVDTESAPKPEPVREHEPVPTPMGGFGRRRR